MTSSSPPDPDRRSASPPSDVAGRRDAPDRGARPVEADRSRDAERDEVRRLRIEVDRGAELAARTRDRARRAEARADRLERELRAVRESTSFRLGHRIVRSARRVERVARDPRAAIARLTARR